MFPCEGGSSEHPDGRQPVVGVLAFVLGWDRGEDEGPEDPTLGPLSG